MDKIAQSANSSRSLRGGEFETRIERILSDLKKKGKVKQFKRKPKVFEGEFNPDFIVEKNNGEIISIDSTTTARTDRLRAKQWDAYGTKKYFSEKGKKITSIVVVDEINTNKVEKDNFRHCKEHCRLPHSALDDTLSKTELIILLKK